MANNVLDLTNKSTGKSERVVRTMITHFYEEEEGVTRIYLVSGLYILVTEDETYISHQLNEA